MAEEFRARSAQVVASQAADRHGGIELAQCARQSAGVQVTRRLAARNEDHGRRLRTAPAEVGGAKVELRDRHHLNPVEPEPGQVADEG